MKKRFYIFVIFLTLVCYFSVYIPPHFFWVAGFITYMIPFVILMNLFLLIQEARKLSLFFLIPLALLIAGWSFIQDTFHYSGGVTHSGKIRVLSYNIRVFDIYDQPSVDCRIPEKMADWIQQTHSDIICLQEFYTEPGTGSRNTLRLINHDKSYYVYDKPVYTNRIGAQFGTVIFSHYPIINQGQIPFEGNTQNQAIFADVIIQSDTVRIYNLHLQSMHIDEKNLMNYEGNLEGEMKDLFGRLKYGFIQRSVQIGTIREHIMHCPYRVIVCGDFNDLPYSFAYHQLKSILHNSFTEVGRGFGFTYNGKLPFLRIDNQFYGKGVQVISFKTEKKMSYSDHFPIIGTYNLTGIPRLQ